MGLLFKKLFKTLKLAKLLILILDLSLFYLEIEFFLFKSTFVMFAQLKGQINCFLHKFSDGPAIVGLITDADDKEYRELTQEFMDYLQNYLHINTRKNMPLVVDFLSHKHPQLQPLNIQGTDIESVENYRYLYVHLNNKLDWTHNSNHLYKKGQSCRGSGHLECRGHS